MSGGKTADEKLDLHVRARVSSLHSGGSKFGTAILIASLVAAPAAAQETERRPGPPTEKQAAGNSAARPDKADATPTADERKVQPPLVLWIGVGAGAGIYPRFPGADRYGLAPRLIFSVRRDGDRVGLRAPDQSAGVGVVGAAAAISGGPVLKLQARRREKDVGAAVGSVGWTLEAGGFAQAFVGERFRLRGELRQGVNGHKGLIGDAGVDLFLRSGDLSTFSIGPRVRWADNKYSDAYYGVTPAVAAKTGLPAFNPGSGIHSLGATAGMRLDVGRGVTVHTYGRYDRLVDDPAQSPIVTRLGSRDQFRVGLGLSFSYKVRIDPAAYRRGPGRPASGHETPAPRTASD